MDLVTHGLLGALVAQSISSSRGLRRAAVIGGVAALLPDLDVLIQSNTDPLLVLEYHRHFTHSIFFAPLAAFLATILIALWVRQELGKFAVYRMVLLAYLSACLLDVCTSYGTHLFWPVSKEPVALAIIAVVDPVFSAILLVALVSAWRGHNRRWAWLGLMFALGYLLFAGFQHHRAEQAALALADTRQLSITRLEVKPTLGNLLLWRAVAVTDDGQLQVDGIRVGVHTQIYQGERRALLNPEDLPLAADSRATRDLQRFQQINKPLLVRHSDDPWMIGDGRYAMLPTNADPLWGLSVNPQQPDSPTNFVTRRRLTPAMRQVFIDMLLGRPVPRSDAAPAPHPQPGTDADSTP